MPILATCTACKAQYKIVNTAAGRRVRCRACAAPFYVPGEPRNVRPAISPTAIAELEATGRREEDDQQALLRYQATLSMLPKQRTSWKPPVAQAPKGVFGRLASWFKGE
jgi:predicted Zn finger-like uncharacterized protein